MKLLRVLPMAKQLLAESVNSGDIVVDATAGNGNDTQFLAGLAGELGHVYAFDIQQAALDSTAKRLGELNSRVSLILDSHENVDQYITDEVGGAMFNLGYLPHGEDLSIVTKPDSTINALHKLLNMLKVGGIISIAVYDGHNGGSNERDALLSYVQSLHQADFQVIKYEQLNRQNNPPFLIAIEKMRSISQ